MAPAREQAYSSRMFGLWNTWYMQAALGDLKRGGRKVRTEEVTRLSPLLYEHVHMLGRYDLTLLDELVGRAMRPLQTPDGLEDYLARIH